MLDASFPAVRPTFALHRVYLSLNGAPYKLAWGRTAIDVPPGIHDVRVYVHESAKSLTVAASVPRISVDARLGEERTLYYRMAAWMFLDGSIGFTPQRARGMVMGIITLVVVVAGIVAFLSYVLSRR